MSTERVLVPVMVDAVGRCGTTALMKLLASAEGALTEHVYPYESRYLTYLYSWSCLLAGDPDAAARWERDRMLLGEQTELGGLPWRELLPDPPEFARKCFLDAWRHFSEAARPSGTHFVEKVPRWISERVPSLLPASRVIYLIRDPRDIWLSMAAFNAKRGYVAFGRTKGQTDVEYFEQFALDLRRHFEPLVGRELGARGILVRYEDLVIESEGVTDTLGEWLGLRFAPEELADRISEHATSNSTADSVARWRRELPDAWRKRFEQELGWLLEAFGYV